MKECLFKPNINREVRSTTPDEMDVSGYKFVKRMKRAQKEKEELEKKKNFDYCI